MLFNVWVRASGCADKSCVEVMCVDGGYLVRDSKDPDAPVLSFTREEWAAFVAGVKAGELGG